MDLEKLKYPIGKFNCPAQISSENIAEWIAVLEDFPNRFSELVKKSFRSTIKHTLPSGRLDGASSGTPRV